MLAIDLYYTQFFNFFKLGNKNKLIRIMQFNAIYDLGSFRPEKKDIWKLFFSNGVTKIVKLAEGGYRSRWWLVLNFQTLDAKESYSIVISRFTYPKEIYQSLSAYLWYYV